MFMKRDGQIQARRRTVKGADVKITYTSAYGESSSYSLTERCSYTRRRRAAGRLRRGWSGDRTEPGRETVRPARRGVVRRLSQRRMHLREERQGCQPGGLLPGEPAQQMQSRRPGGVRGDGTVPTLGCVRGRLPGGAPAQSRGQEQLPDRRRSRTEVQDCQRLVQIQAFGSGHGGAERHGAGGLEGPGAELEELGELRRLVQVWEEGVQNGWGDTDRQAAVQTENNGVGQTVPRVGVSEFGGHDHGEEEERPPGEESCPPGAQHSLQQCGGEEGGRLRLMRLTLSGL